MSRRKFFTVNGQSSNSKEEHQVHFVHVSNKLLHFNATTILHYSKLQNVLHCQCHLTYWFFFCNTKVINWILNWYFNKNSCKTWPKWQKLDDLDIQWFKLVSIRLEVFKHNCARANLIHIYVTIYALLN